MTRRRIELLDATESARIQSSADAVDGVLYCVQALVENALDANSSSIAVRINPGQWNVQVIDNGKGINEDDFAMVGER